MFNHQSIMTFKNDSVFIRCEVVSAIKKHPIFYKDYISITEFCVYPEYVLTDVEEFMRLAMQTTSRLYPLMHTRVFVEEVQGGIKLPQLIEFYKSFGFCVESEAIDTGVFMSLIIKNPAQPQSKIKRIIHNIFGESNDKSNNC